jgi:mRNA interferase HigB
MAVSRLEMGIVDESGIDVDEFVKCEDNPSVVRHEWFMRIISPKMLRQFWAVYPSAREPLSIWRKNVRAAKWRSFSEVKAALGSRVDRYKQFVIFDIGGNKYRLIVVIHYNRGIVYIRHVLTHAEYDKNKWKGS